MKQINDDLYANVWALPVVNITHVAAFGPKVAEYTPQTGNPYPGPFTGVSLM